MTISMTWEGILAGVADYGSHPKSFNVDVDLQSLLDAPTVAEMTLTIDGLIAQTDSNEHNRSERKKIQNCPTS